MKLFSNIGFTLLAIIALAFTFSCSSELDFSTNPADKLTFSADTVRFDTVFTSIGSSTRQLKIFNRGKKPLKIESINLAGGDANGFSVVVDGQKGTSFSNIEIGAKDSLFVFVEVKVNPHDANNPILISDSLMFRLNGNTQKVRMEAYGQDVIILRGKTLKSDTTLNANRPFLIYDSLIVANTSKLNLASGVKLFFHDKAFCRIDGQISSKGTVQEPVVFRGDRMDRMLSDLPYDLYSGLWGGVSISRNSYGNEMEYTQIRNGMYALRLDSANTDNEKIRLLNCKLTNVMGTVFSAMNCKVTAYGCEFSNGGTDVVALNGGDYSFVHCTLENHFLYDNGAFSSSPYALHLQNYKLTSDGAWSFCPLVKADFLNCILWGVRSTDINFDNKPKGYAVNTDFKYHFGNCLIKSDGTDDADFVSTIWNKDPKFINEGNNYKFDLRLDSASVAIDAGDYGSAQVCPVDMLGHSRFADSKPDLGAYERVK
ncbi:choice-of-anchor Q domain-containing protein [Parabacteroides sp. FAFU027]|uniref:choice-of-anchor Q domain-containing protein n=1 Tax=Parabacteroides sp. FAFU027 TaxID=2922715 RepID=UPI001FAEE18C|nr:choice-of-anchor Q domain-containing protein [Parabacteroides sp. FAFU027]